MVEPAQLPARSVRETEARLRIFIGRCSGLQPWATPIDFAAKKWTVSAERAGHPKTTVTLDFSSYNVIEELAKAYINEHRDRTGAASPGHQRYVKALAKIDAAATKRGISSPIYLTPQVLADAEEQIRQSSHSITHAGELARVIYGFGRFLLEERLTLVPLRWERTLTSARSMDVFTQEARQKAKDFLPPRDALDALAKLRNPIENAVRAGSERGRLDLILYWIVVILFATGLRANELLTLPIDFLISKQEADPQGNVRKVTYLIRRTSKNGPPDMKMLSPLAKALCRKAQRYLRILTRPAREMSEWLEANPGDVQIVGPRVRTR